MNKAKQIEELSNILAEHFKEPIDEPCIYCEVAEALYAVGVRKVEKPPVLTDEEITKLIDEKWNGDGYDMMNVGQFVAQAAAEAAYKFMMEEIR